VREIRTHGSIGRGPETGSRRRLHGHEAGNGGHSQVRAYGVPRRSPTLRSAHWAARAFPTLSKPVANVTPETVSVDAGQYLLSLSTTFAATTAKHLPEVMRELDLPQVVQVRKRQPTQEPGQDVRGQGVDVTRARLALNDPGQVRATGSSNRPRRQGLRLHAPIAPRHSHLTRSARHGSKLRGCEVDLASSGIPGGYRASRSTTSIPIAQPTMIIHVSWTALRTPKYL
jgi:hypothetical protein